MKKIVFGIAICLLLVTACAEFRENFESEYEPGSELLKTLSIKEVSFYWQESLITSFKIDEEHRVATISNDTDFFNRWSTILEKNCETHRPNHPRYNKTYIATVTFEDIEEPAYYTLRIDSDDNDEIDFVPINAKNDAGRTTIFETGIYRCEGLKELVEETIP